jgi:DNA-binding NtrC family response regulator
LKNTVERGVIMARGDKLQLADLMPRNLKQSADLPPTLTINVGASMQDAQRQLMLRTFASSDGDIDRTARTLGVRAEDVRKELMALLTSQSTNGDGPEHLRQRRSSENPKAKAGRKK